MHVPTAFRSLLCATIAAVTVSACGGAASNGPSSSAALSQGTSVMPHVVTISPTEKMIYIPAAAHGAVPAGTPPIINGWVSLSLAINGLPCQNCAGNPAINGSLGVAFPLPYFPLANNFEITYTFYNVSEGSSACNLVFGIKQGTTSLFSHTYAITLNGDGQYVYYVATSLSSKAVAGAAGVSAHVKCGTVTGKTATQAVYLH